MEEQMIHHVKGWMMMMCFVSAVMAADMQQPGRAGSDALSVIHSRKSVRHFTGAKVEKQQLETIVKAGMAAPTAVNKQPWSFVVISDRTLLDKLAEGLPYAKMLDKAGAAIIVIAHPDRAYEGSRDFAIIDACCASQNILLAVESLGLGAVWTAAYPDTARVEHVRKVLGIPADAIPLNVIPIGVPTGEDKPKDKFRVENIHWDKW